MYVTEKGTRELPGVTIGDSSVENFGWQWFHGWQGIIPSQSTLEDCKILLGEVTETSELANGMTYDFLHGQVRITILDGSSHVFKAWIDRQAAFPFTPPPTIDDASEYFGRLITTGVNRYEGCLLERPGMRICCNAMDETNPILWMEIWKPQAT